MLSLESYSWKRQGFELPNQKHMGSTGRAIAELSSVQAHGRQLLQESVVAVSHIDWTLHLGS